MDLQGGNLWTVHDFWYIYQLASQNAYQINWMESSSIYTTIEKYKYTENVSYIFIFLQNIENGLEKKSELHN